MRFFSSTSPTRIGSKTCGYVACATSPSSLCPDREPPTPVDVYDDVVNTVGRRVQRPRLHRSRGFHRLPPAHQRCVSDDQATSAAALPELRAFRAGEDG